MIGLHVLSRPALVLGATTCDRDGNAWHVIEIGVDAVVLQSDFLRNSTRRVLITHRRFTEGEF